MALYLARHSVVELKTLPAGVYSAWGGKKVYERAWKAYIVEEGKQSIGIFFRIGGKDWKVVEEKIFDSKKDLKTWAKNEEAIDLEAENP